MTRVASLQTLIDHVTDKAGRPAVERTLRRTGMTEMVAELKHGRVTRIPFELLYSFSEAASKEAGDPLLGLNAGMALPLEAYGLWLKYACAGRSLRVGLSRLAAAEPIHQTGAPQSMSEDGQNAVWTYHMPRSNGVPVRHQADFVVPLALRFFRHYVGPDWSPDWIDVGYARDDRHGSREDATGVAWRFGGTGVQIGFPAALLDRARPSPASDPSVLLDVAAQARLDEARSVVSLVEAMITLHFLDARAPADLAGIAARLGLGTRTREGTSLAGILDEVRRRKANALLRETDLSAAAIGRVLGYSDPANFTRAVLRWTGRPPTGFRHHDGAEMRAGQLSREEKLGVGLVDATRQAHVKRPQNGSPSSLISAR